MCIVFVSGWSALTVSSFSHETFNDDDDDDDDDVLRSFCAQGRLNGPSDLQR